MSWASFWEGTKEAFEGWKGVGKAAWDDPLGMVVPGVMEAWRNPSSAEAWEKAAVDVGMYSQCSYCRCYKKA